MSITYQVFQKASSYLEKYARETFITGCRSTLARGHSSDDPGDQEPPERRGFCARPTLASFQTQQQGMLMSIALPDSRALLRLTLASIALALGLGRAAVASEVTTPVEQLHAGLMAIMKAGKTAPFRQRYDMIAPVIGRTFDLEVILRQVIGPRLAALPPDQRAAVGDAFRRYTIASYVANFDTYSGQRFEVAPVVRAAGSDRVVETQIAAASGQGYVLDYVMRQESGGWKVVDVLVDGAISRVAAQRSEMRSMLADSGGAGLLVGLRQKTADLSGGILQ